ncbi:MAG: tetratricopeptide repeat protein [Lewinellaceae bacterium]|nr:tetratricopeptide repeat protein [Lewinellaceae bacterium]
MPSRRKSSSKNQVLILKLPWLESREQQIAWILLGLMYLTYVIWGLSSSATWDEDCPTRYFNALAAIHDPSQFISFWNRPLFIVLFFLPVHLGKAIIPIMMSAISGAGAYFLYKSSKLLKWNFAFMAIPFLMLQPYFLGVGRDAMTEPLAATIISAGIYLALEKKWLLFALVGALLPLARAEMSVLLILWAWVLLMNKQWKMIPLLGAGVLLWDLAGWVIEGDPLYVVNTVLHGAPDENRYGHQPADTYLRRYFYVIGPTIFFFFLLGILGRIKSKSVSWLIDGQFYLGFLVYTLFAWKVNLGQSAGFLRNLIPISPLSAMIALWGLNEWMLGMTGNLKKTNWTLIRAGAVISLILTGFFFRNHIRLHHLVEDKLDYFNLPIVGILTLVTFIGPLFLRKKDNNKWYLVVLLGLTFTLLASHTLITENPQANSNLERQMMEKVVNIYKELGFESAPMTFASHGWFYWTAGYNRNDSKFSLMKLEEIEKAPEGSICIWESHFSNRLGSNVPEGKLEGNKNFVLLAKVFSQDINNQALIFVKTDGKEPAEKVIDDAIAKHPDIAELYVRRMELNERKGFLDQARADLIQASKAEPENSYVTWLMASELRNQNKNDLALNLLNQLIEANNNNYNALMMKGKLLNTTQDYKSAVEVFNAMIKLNANQPDPYIERGLSYTQLGKNSQACNSFKTALKLKSSRAQSYIDQYCK